MCCISMSKTLIIGASSGIGAALAANVTAFFDNERKYKSVLERRTL